MKVELNTEKDKASYALGMQLGSNFQQQGLAETLDIDYLIAGLKAQIEGTTLLNMAETDAILNTFFDALQKVQFEENIKKGEEFLAENAKREGVYTTASGLQYEILVEGNGPKPSATSTVKTHYEGTLLDGTVFDSSYQRGEPISFPLNGVIPAWTEGLQLMSVGSKYKLYVPYNLGYGERGAGQQIGPYETLIFVVELIDIEK
ncbi:FKBP-type peptidyl-prolyl cis-trans isomerase [Bacteroidales bacterium OttesenSCG-928-K03]|nr:FKBP-type peptidyl-prolyl cis-trans isomerase [Bacteroidales bacterium OttesenSCG-928-K03]